VRFTHADGGLIADRKPLQSFELAGADRKFFPATARIDRETVVVSAPGVPEPVAVRYAWTNNPTPTSSTAPASPPCRSAPTAGNHS
jgi:sialate O-acetylesterase